MTSYYENAVHGRKILRKSFVRVRRRVQMERALSRSLSVYFCCRRALRIDLCLDIVLCNAEFKTIASEVKGIDKNDSVSGHMRVRILCTFRHTQQTQTHTHYTAYAHQTKNTNQINLQMNICPFADIERLIPINATKPWILFYCHFQN